MGTRSLTVVMDEYKKEICVLYRQFDGYPTGHGKELKDFLKGFQIVNGMSINQTGKTANGMDCLTAQLIAHFKKGPGNFYLYPTGTRDCGEEYIYTIYPVKPDDVKKAVFRNMTGLLYLKVQTGVVTYYGFPGTKQANMPVIYDGSVEDFDPVEVEREWHESNNEPPNDFPDDQILSSEVIS